MRQQKRISLREGAGNRSLFLLSEVFSRMVGKEIVREIEQLLAAKFHESEFEDCFLIEIKLPKPNKLEVFLDADSGITFEKCQRISRYLESYIDTNNWLGENYTLEVSSAGIDRPLKLLRQYKKNIGRKIEVSQKEGATIEGKLLDADDTKITIEAKVKLDGEKKATLRPVEIAFDNIKKAVIRVSW